MAVWGLCVTASNKPIAVKAGLVETLSSWSAVLLLAGSPFPVLSLFREVAG
jgi:hypothetical protein